jgi:cytochrome b561
MQLGNSAERWGPVSKLLHWSIVALIIAQFVLAEAAEDLPDGIEKLATLARHKSIGMLILGLALARIAWRLASPGPKSSPTWPKWQRTASGMSHGLLYLLVLLQPLSGWLMSSAANYPVSFFGWFQFPNLLSASEQAAEFFEEFHEVLATGLLVVAIVHALAALYHHFLLKDEVLRRMLPW